MIPESGGAQHISPIFNNISGAQASKPHVHLYPAGLRLQEKRPFTPIDFRFSSDLIK